MIASDGVWEFIDSQQAVDLIAKFISKGSTVCTRPLRTHPSVNSQWCALVRVPAHYFPADWRPPNAPAWPLHDMRGSRGVGDARAVRPLRALSDACRPDGRDCAPAGLMGVCARIRRRSRSSSRQLRPSGAKRRGITVMTSPPSASKSAMGSSRRLSREPGQGAWAPPRQHAGNSRWPCLNSHANGHDNGRQHASGIPRCSWPEGNLAQHSAISPNTARDARGQSAISPNTARPRPELARYPSGSTQASVVCVCMYLQQLIASRVHSHI